MVQTQTTMSIKEKVEAVFFCKKPLRVFNENEKEALMKMACEGDLHAACVLVEGMHLKYRSWDEPFINEETGETVLVTRTELIEGSTFEKNNAEEAKLIEMIFSAKDKMSDEELKMACHLPIDTLPLLMERIRRGDDEAALYIDNPEILYDLCEKGNKFAAEQLGYKYDAGDEKNYIFVNPRRAKEYFDMAGVDYEYQKREEDPHEADYFLHGSAEELARVKEIINRLTQRFGTPNNELGLFLPMEHLMFYLVGSNYYEGNLLGMNTDDPACIILHAEANGMRPLLYALRQRFPNLDIEMRETAI